MVTRSLLILALLIMESYTFEHEAKQEPEEMTFIGGSIDGKRYFTVPNQYFTWQEAKDICKRHNLTMASIRSAAQTHALTKAYMMDQSLGIVWTSARDYSENINSLKWDNTVDSQPDEKLFVRFQGSPYFTQCGWYETASNMFYTSDCTQTKRKVLCQDNELP